MKIGALAKASGCAVETIRYYEKIGLLPTADRLANGYRVYSERHQQWLRFILKSRSLGFTQAQVMSLVELACVDTQPCTRVRQVVQEHLADVQQKQRELARIEEALKRLERACEAGSELTCPAIDELMRDSD